VRRGRVLAARNAANRAREHAKKLQNGSQRSSTRAS
jgi:hypothetical protein